MLGRFWKADKGDDIHLTRRTCGGSFGLFGQRGDWPEELVFTYALRNEEEEEVEVVRTLVRVAAWWVTRVDLNQE